MKDLIKKSKWLALILRHHPEKAKLVLDEHGWAQVSDVTDPHKGDITWVDLLEIVKSDDKGRYEFNHNKTAIRAVQGHSIDSIDIELEEATPPDHLFHGTKKNFLDSILLDGLKSMGRQHVHLSPDKTTAQIVADRRKGISVVLEINTKKMKEDGIKFYLAKNGVWLTELVEPKYIKS